MSCSYVRLDHVELAKLEGGGGPLGGEMWQYRARSVHVHGLGGWKG